MVLQSQTINQQLLMEMPREVAPSFSQVGLFSQPMDKYHKVVKAYEMGLSIQNLAEHYQISRQAMWKILMRRGCQFRSNLRYGEENHFHRGTEASDKAQNLLEQAIEDGKVVRQTVCEACGTTGIFKDGRTAIQAHHPDYDKPLEVMWLCQPCHHEIHRANTAKEVIATELNRQKAYSFLRGGSHDYANHFPVPGSDEARRMTVTSGERCCELFLRYVPDGSLRRMCQGLLASITVWSSRIVFLSWKEKVTPHNRLLFQLVPSTPRTDGIGCGLLRTCAATDAERGAHPCPDKKAGQHSLVTQIAMLPTPASRDWKSEKCSDATFERNARPLSETLGKNRGLKLQPAFVEWMMGYPDKWTELSD